MLSNLDTSEAENVRNIQRNSASFKIGNRWPIVAARALMLSAPSEGLPAKLTSPNSKLPIDYKRGAVPDNPQQSWEPERVGHLLTMSLCGFGFSGPRSTGNIGARGYC